MMILEADCHRDRRLLDVDAKHERIQVTSLLGFPLVGVRVRVELRDDVVEKRMVLNQQQQRATDGWGEVQVCEASASLAFRYETEALLLLLLLHLHLLNCYCRHY